MMKTLSALSLLALVQVPAYAQQSMDHSKMNHGAAGQMNHGSSGQMKHGASGQMNHNMKNMKNTPANPFAEAEMRRHQRMMQAAGANPDETWARKMIEHHRNAIETGNILLSKGADQQLKAMARKSIAEQQKEIDELQTWLRTHGKNAQ
jgi:uncharacterized protein (DUF305 family)